MIAVIAGTGLTESSTGLEYLPVSTPYGDAFLAERQFGRHRVVLMARHGPGLNIPPHLVNYRANIWALRQSGVRVVISTAAVGSLGIDLTPGTLAVVTDFIDFTKQRPFTFFEQPQNAVVHTDFSTPYCPSVTRALREAAKDTGAEDLPQVTYACMEGPRYETPAEVRALASLGADVVGMTGFPEVVLAREAGLCYGSLAIIANYAAGISPTPLSHEEVVARVSEQGAIVQDLLARTVGLLERHERCSHCRASDIRK